MPLEKSKPMESRETEAVLVGLWINYSNVVVSSPVLVSEEFFADDRLREVWRSIHEVRSNGNPPNLFTVSQHLHSRRMLEAVGGVPFLKEIADEFGAAPSTYDHHARHVVELASKRRFMASLADAVARLGAEPDVGFAEHCEAVCSEILRIQRAQSGKRRREFADIADISAQRLAAAHAPLQAAEARNSAMLPVPTGIRGLDAVITGLMAGKTYCIGARPAVGKSAVGAAIVASIASAGHRCAVASLEMPDYEVFERVVAMRSGIPWEQAVRDASTVGRVLDAISQVATLPIVTDDTAGMSLGKLGAWARAEKAGKGLRVLFVDYLQLMRGTTSRNGTREQEVASVSRGLKELAKELEIAVIFAAQLTRDASNRRPTMADLRESGSIEQDADVIMLLHTESKPEAGEDVIDLEIIVEKQRGGRTGLVSVEFDKPRMRFYDAAQAPQAPKGGRR